MGRKKLFLLAWFIGLLLLAGLAYAFNSKFHFFADVLEGPYTIFQKENFAQVTWDSQPTANEILKDGDMISTFTSQGQTEDVSFSVRPNVDLGEVQLDVSDLKMGDKVIPAANIEVLNLKVWDQCAQSDSNKVDDWIMKCHSSTYTKHVNVPELLVKDNEQDLAAAEAGWGRYPEVNQIFKAILTSGKTHTFYLRIKTPPDAERGSYSGKISFRPANQVPERDINLSVEVLPFQLPDTDKEILVHAGYRIAETPGAYNQNGRPNIGEAKYSKYLDFLRKSGVTGLVVSDYQNIDKVARMMKEKGFSKIIWRAIGYPEGQWISDPYNYYKAQEIKDKIGQIKAAGFSEVYVYGYDEPNTGETLFRNLQWAKFVHAAGGKIASSITKQIHDISSNNSNPLSLHDGYGISVEEGKTDLPIYAGINSNSAIYGDWASRYFERSWSFPMLNDTPSLQVFPRAETVTIKKVTDASGSQLPEYTKSLAKDAWHHVAGVWDGQNGQYKLYVDNEQSADFDYSYQVPISPFGNNLPKNTNRTYIGAAIDAPKPSSDGKSRDAIVGFRGSLSGIKIYNKALSKEEIDAGSVAPKANYDFSNGELTDTTGSYPACQIVLKDEGQLEFRDDSHIAGKKSLYFSGNKNGPSATGVPDSPHLDCGKIEDNYGIVDSMTVEFWVKLPNDTSVSNIHGAIISRLEANDRQHLAVEDYIVGLRKNTTPKNSQKEFFYNQMWSEGGTVADKRGYSGFFLESSRLDGYAPYGLDAPYNFSGPKVYYDFDRADPNNPNSAAAKDEYALYPSASGDPVLTYQFEAFRAGVDDSRYMTLYNDLLTQVKTKDSAKAAEIDQPVQLMLDQYPYNMNGDNQSFVGKPNSYHQANRRLIADKIIEIQGILSHKSFFIDRLNVSEGQKIKSNPYMLSVKVKNPADISKVEYYIDEILIGTATLPDVNGVYDWPWDTSKYHSLVRIVVYGTDGSKEEILRNTTVSLSDDGATASSPAAYKKIAIVLPKTGRSDPFSTLKYLWSSIASELKTAF